jgi:putative transposase
VDLTTDTSNRHVVDSNTSHVVWCPKYRRTVWVGAVAKGRERLLNTLCPEMQVDLLALAIRPDPGHLLVDVDPQFGVHRLVKWLKGHTSPARRLKVPALKSRLPTRWTQASFLSTVGGAPRSVRQQDVGREQDG